MAVLLMPGQRGAHTLEDHGLNVSCTWITKGPGPIATDALSAYLPSRCFSSNIPVGH